MPFNRCKFLDFPKKQQHKKCAELLRQVYENPTEEAIAHYNELQTWMEGEPLTKRDKKTISDRYHYHLGQTKFRLSEPNFLPRVRQGDRETPAGDLWPIAIYLDHLRSAHNVGSILRTVEAFSLGKVYFSPDTPYIDHNQVKKASMGAVVYTECYKEVPPDALPRPIIALETAEQALPLYDFLFPEKFTLAIGNEEYGCSDALLEEADYLIEIPLRGRKNSLNVANAFAIAAAEISKQRNHCNAKQTSYDHTVSLTSKGEPPRSQ